MGVATGPFPSFIIGTVATPVPANTVRAAGWAAHGFRTAMPLVPGVVPGMQIVIRSIGLGLIALADRAPAAFLVLKAAPGFAARPIVHPLDPGAWLMAIAAFIFFSAPGSDPFATAALIAIGFFATQITVQSPWRRGGDRPVGSLAGKPGERLLMYALAALTVASVVLVLLGGEEV